MERTHLMSILTLGFRHGLRAIGPFLDDHDYLNGWWAGLRLAYACEGLTLNGTTPRFLSGDGE